MASASSTYKYDANGKPVKTTAYDYSGGGGFAPSSTGATTTISYMKDGQMVNEDLAAYHARQAQQAALAAAQAAAAGPTGAGNAASGIITSGTTPAQAYSFAQPDYGNVTGLMTAENAAQAYRVGGMSEADKAKTRSDVLAQFQAEIDAQNGLYAEKLRQARMAGANRIGSNTALQASSGLLASNIGQSQTSGIVNENLSVESGINSEKTSAVSALLKQARDAGDAAIKEKITAKQSGLDAYVALLQAQGARSETNAQKAAQAIISSGLDLSTIHPDDLQKMATGFGITTDAIKSAYGPLKQAHDAAVAKAAIDAEKTVSPGQTIVGPDGKVIYQAPAADTGFTLSPGQTRFDANGKQIAGVAPKGTGGGGGGTVIPGVGPTTAQTTGSISNDVKAVLEGRNTLYNIRQTMGRTNAAAAYMQKMRDSIAAIDPSFDFVASDAGGKAVSSAYFQRSIAAINSVLPNIDKIVDLSNQVSRVGVRGVDALLQKGQVQIGNRRVANFKEAQKLIADEIGLALGAGTVSDMKLQLGFDVTDPSVSQEVFASNMEIVKEFVNNRKAGLESLRYQSPTASSGDPTSELHSDIQAAASKGDYGTREQLIERLAGLYHELTKDQIASMVYQGIPDKR